MNQRPALPAAYASQIRTARELAEDRKWAPEETRLTTAAAALDRLLEGGLRRGGMAELIGGRSSGRFSLVLSALAATTSMGEAAALVDLGDGFDPQAAAAAGVDQERLLWVRPRTMKETLASAEVILATGMPLVAIELGMPPLRGGRGVEAAWLRLARSARAHRVALLVASPYRVSGTAAQVVLKAQEVQALWQGRGGAPRLLRGISSRLALVKSRHRRPGGGDEALSLRLENDCLGADPRGKILPFTPHGAEPASPGRAAA